MKLWKRSGSKGEAVSWFSHWRMCLTKSPRAGTHSWITWVLIRATINIWKLAVGVDKDCFVLSVETSTEVSHYKTPVLPFFHKYNLSITNEDLCWIISVNHEAVCSRTHRSGHPGESRGSHRYIIAHCRLAVKYLYSFPTNNISPKSTPTAGELFRCLLASKSKNIVKLRCKEQESKLRAQT